MGFGPPTGHWRRTALFAAIAALLLGWGWIDVRGRAMPETGREGQKTDLTVYLEAARALQTGQDIYEVRNVRNWPYLYPPLAAVLFVPVADLSRGAAAYIWFVVSLGCLVASILTMRAALRRIDAKIATRACLLGLLPVAIPALHTLQRGQVNALVLLLVCLAIYALVRRWGFLAGLWLALAAAIKVTPGLAAGYFLWKYLQHQVRSLGRGTWRPGTLLEQTAAPIGFAVGLLLGLVVIPGLYMGQHQAAAAVVTWRYKVAGGYMTANAQGHLFGDETIHETSDRNQTWYRAAASTMYLLDPAALQKRDLLRPDYQVRMWWLLLTVGLVLAGVLAWHCRSERTQETLAAPCAELAAFVWLAISFGKIAWGHFYVVIYPLTAIAWFVAGRQADNRQGVALRRMCWVMVLACLLHYGLTGGKEAKDPSVEAKGRRRTRVQAKEDQPAIPRDLGGLLLPAALLALGTIIVANPRDPAVDCAPPAGASLAATQTVP